MTAVKRILLIDDDEDHLSLCNLILQRKGYIVTTLSIFDQIMERTLAFRPHIIFVDHYMNGGTGIEATRMIKSHPELKNIPVIYFSSCEDIVKRAEEAGADAYLGKPFEFDRFVEIARKFLM